jgi:hypothetical protein
MTPQSGLSMENFLGGRCLLLRKRGCSQVWPDDFHFRPQLLCILGLDRWCDNNIVAGDPVDWGSDLPLVTRL